ncbi:MAG: hypothetical protein HFF17_02675 [Oscillospiraceae bacterium]|nr:hypothetical protein [Oscillospiraceae bacterium]
MERQRHPRPQWLRIALIFLCVGVLFAALWYGADLIGQARQGQEPPEGPPAAPAEESDGLIPGLDRNEYDLEAFSWDGNYIVYDGAPPARRGIDVSAHQGIIDWAAVAADGVEYAMIRVGYRGYTEGVTSLDELFYDNVGGARAQGLDVGVYFFSQAISVEEAVEEAEIVLRAIGGIDITYPIIYDWEDIQQEARTDGMDPVTLTACARAFCETIEAAGYRAGIYFNQRLGYQEFDLVSLQDYLFWLAQYADAPDFAYDFEMWQYTNAGQVAGIEGDVDLNLSFWKPGE